MIEQKKELNELKAAGQSIKKAAGKFTGAANALKQATVQVKTAVAEFEKVAKAIEVKPPKK